MDVYGDPLVAREKVKHREAAKAEHAAHRDAAHYLKSVGDHEGAARASAEATFHEGSARFHNSFTGHGQAGMGDSSKWSARPAAVRAAIARHRSKIKLW